MKKLLTLLSLMFFVTAMAGCNIEHAREANPNCYVYPVDGSLTDYTYLMYDRTTEVIKFVRINDSGHITKTYGTITLDEWVNKELPLRSVEVGRETFMSPINWVDNNFSSRHMYIVDDRIMYGKSSKYKTEVLNLNALLKKIENTRPVFDVVNNEPVDNTRQINIPDYITVTNYVDTAKPIDATVEKYKNIDFNFHD